MAMALREQAEELLESLWIELIENGKKTSDSSVLRRDAEVQRLVEEGYLSLDNELLKLTDQGELEGQNCARRHRLAERLMTDVLQYKGPSLHETSCRFEHLLHKGLDESICTLLGHPRTCPHGRNIPEGACCVEARKVPEKVVMTLAELQKDRPAVVSHLRTDDRDTLQKLLLIGALPGTQLTVRQRFPAFVLKLGNSEFAIDRELATHVYVRPSKPEHQ